MRYSISIHVVDDEKTTRLGEFDLTYDAALSSLGIGLKGAEAVTPRGVKLTLRSGYELTPSNLSVLVLANDVQVFMGLAHWDKVTPYFGFRIASGEFVQLYFHKASATEPPPS